MFAKERKKFAKWQDVEKNTDFREDAGSVVSSRVQVFYHPHFFTFQRERASSELRVPDLPRGVTHGGTCVVKAADHSERSFLSL